MGYIYIHNTMCTKRHYIILRAAAPAADPGKNFLVLRTLRLSPFFLCILLWNIFDRLELVFENGFFIWVYVNIMILCFSGFMDLSNCIIVIYIYILWVLHTGSPLSSSKMNPMAHLSPKRSTSSRFVLSNGCNATVRGRRGSQPP